VRAPHERGTDKKRPPWRGGAVAAVAVVVSRAGGCGGYKGRGKGFAGGVRGGQRAGRRG